MTFFATPSKRAAIFAATFLLASVPAFAQLTITSSDFANGFYQYTTNQKVYVDAGTTGLQSLIDQTGANQSWNIQAIPFVLDTSVVNSNGSVVPYSSSFPEADSFPTATHVEKSITNGISSYYFYEINQTGLYLLGISQDSMGLNPKVYLTYTPPFEDYAFPLTYQTQWSSTSVISSGAFGYTMQEDNLVDSWGTYSLPDNSPIQALRVRRRTTAIYSFGNDTSYSFEWFNLSNFSATIDADVDQNATRAQYAVPGSTNIVSGDNSSLQFSIAIASNPVSSPTNVSFTLPSESQVRISLMDALGRQSQVLMNGMAHTGLNTLSLDPASLMNGTYFLRIESDGNSAMQKVIVNH